MILTLKVCFAALAYDLGSKISLPFQGHVKGLSRVQHAMSSWTRSRMTVCQNQRCVVVFVDQFSLH